MIPIDERAVRARAGVQRPPYAVQKIDSLCALYDGGDRGDEADEGDGSHEASGTSLFAHTPARPEHDDPGQQNAGGRERVVWRDGDRNPGELGRRQRRRQPQCAPYRDGVRIDRSNECDRHRNQLRQAGERDGDQGDVERAIAVARDVRMHRERHSQEQARCGYPDPRVDTSCEERDPREHDHQPRGGRRIERSTPRSIGRSSSCTCSRSNGSNSTCCG